MFQHCDDLNGHPPRDLFALLSGIFCFAQASPAGQSPFAPSTERGKSDMQSFMLTSVPEAGRSLMLTPDPSAGSDTLLG
jgi:hypothetical protein